MKIKDDPKLDAQVEAQLVRKIDELQKLCVRAADALEMWARWPRVPELIAQLRKAGE